MSAAIELTAKIERWCEYLAQKVGDEIELEALTTLSPDSPGWDQAATLTRLSAKNGAIEAFHAVADAGGLYALLSLPEPPS